MKRHERHELELAVPLPPEAQFEHVKTFAATKRFRVEKIRVRVVVRDGKAERNLGLTRGQPYRLMFFGPRLTKRGDGEIETDDYWDNTLEPLPPDLRAEIEAEVTAFIDRYSGDR